MKQRFDIAIIGSSFSGSILAWILAKQGRRVLMVDSATHPRFAIGESSTPIADMLLARLGERYGLTELVDLASFGRWQQTHSNLACGMKRGFSYFDHQSGCSGLAESFSGQRSLLVAASPSDQRSDTHWYRPDVDAFFFQQATAAGTHVRQAVAVTGLTQNHDGSISICLGDGATESADFVVDASGRANVAARAFNRPSLVERLQTRTCASFAHFHDVGSFSQRFNHLHSDRRASVPFDADDAAQHHVIDDGWVWMLRMNNSVTSVGVTSSTQGRSGAALAATIARTAEQLDQRFAKYPDLHQVMRDSTVIAPASGITTMSQLQRFYDPVVLENCLLLPATAATIDPLHSTGIAHSLAGVDRIARLLLGQQRAATIHDYRHRVLDETVHLDRLVSAAYRCLHSFSRLTTACMLYFAAAIGSEESIASGNEIRGLWLSDDPQFVAIVNESVEILDSDSSDANANSRIRKLIQPWNTAGLLDDRVANRYAYTATK
ncbi:tryptophan 7-halogenase [Stieleria sp. TO1_6]|uniref:NAD(P)/FAD-dependent oxidoreductase n=1 Tax=Stieleria tagensis TaxID=2956795 RepID=UPI00209B8F8E|nr:tryptophan 7-halogenase [Stieleria tagensis]MCO8122473.1 tryptophan 7-halogenase [Stieleria tagensis]